MLDLHNMFEEGRGDSRATGLWSCLSRQLEIPLTPENLRVFLFLDLRGIVGRSDFYPAGRFSQINREQKNCLKLLPRLWLGMSLVMGKLRVKGSITGC